MNKDTFELSFEKQFTLRKFENALKNCIKTNMTEEEIEAVIKEVVSLYSQNMVKDNIISDMVKNGFSQNKIKKII